MPPPRPFLQAMVSPYSIHRPDFVERKAQADRLAESSLVVEARELNAQTVRVGIQFLRERLAGRIEWPEHRGHICIGMFAGDSEPSSALPFYFKSDAEMMAQSIILKRALIEFGEHFAQQNVHLLAYKTTEPCMPVGEVEEGDWMSQEVHTVRFGHMLPNYLLRLGEARRCNIQHLTITEMNEQAMIYSIGQLDPSFANNVRCFQDMAGLSHAVDSSSGRVLLWNVGNREYGATHTYDEWSATYGS